MSIKCGCNNNIYILLYLNYYISGFKRKCTIICIYILLYLNYYEPIAGVTFQLKENLYSTIFKLLLYTLVRNNTEYDHLYSTIFKLLLEICIKQVYQFKYIYILLYLNYYYEYQK